jgi:hypothetical protein
MSKMNLNHVYLNEYKLKDLQLLSGFRGINNVLGHADYNRRDYFYHYFTGSILSGSARTAGGTPPWTEHARPRSVRLRITRKDSAFSCRRFPVFLSPLGMA